MSHAAIGYKEQILRTGDIVKDTRVKDSAPILLINTMRTLVVYATSDGHIHYRPARFFKKVS